MLKSKNNSSSELAIIVIMDGSKNLKREPTVENACLVKETNVRVSLRHTNILQKTITGHNEKKDKRRDLTKCCDTNPNFNKAFPQCGTIETFDYTQIVDRSGTVSWSDNSHPTCVVNLYIGSNRSTPVTLVQSKRHSFKKKTVDKPLYTNQRLTAIESGNAYNSIFC